MCIDVAPRTSHQRPSTQNWSTPPFPALRMDRMPVCMAGFRACPLTTDLRIFKHDSKSPPRIMTYRLLQRVLVRWHGLQHMHANSTLESPIIDSKVQRLRSNAVTMVPHERIFHLRTSVHLVERFSAASPNFLWRSRHRARFVGLTLAGLSLVSLDGVLGVYSRISHQLFYKRRPSAGPGYCLASWYGG
jgi:hypothetical protein